MELKLTKLFFWHLLFYVLFYEVRPVLDDQSLENLFSWLEWKGGWLNLSSMMTFFWFSLGTYLTLYYYYPKSMLKVVLGLIATIALGLAGRYFIEEIFYLHAFGFDNFNDKMSTLSYVVGNLFYTILHVSLGGVFFFMQYGNYKARQEQRLLIENKKTELAYLRSQVNPHFLFNTLNNIYSLVYQKSDKALPALEKLTAMLRYGLYEGAGNIPLKKEIDSVQNFISLEEMRYDYALNIDFEVKGTIGQMTTPPFILLPFVENAFKHGDMKAPLKIHLEVNDQSLKFDVHNKIKAKQKDKVGGIGLENIKKRLELIYGDNYELNIHENEKTFDVKLIIEK